MVKISIAVKDSKPLVTISAETPEDAQALMQLATAKTLRDGIEITWTPEAAELFWN